MEHFGGSLEHQPVERNVDSGDLVLEVSERNRDSWGKQLVTGYLVVSR